MKKLTFRDYVELVKITNNGYSIEEIPLNDTLTIDDKHLINFHYLLIFCIIGKRNKEEIINSKKKWITYLLKHDNPEKAKKIYYKHIIDCFYKLKFVGFYNMNIYYKTYVTNEVFKIFKTWINSFTLLPLYANKIKKWWLKYK